MTPIKMPVPAGNTVRSSAGDSTGASSAPGVLSFGDLLRSHSPATSEKAASAETPVIPEPLPEDSSVGEPADQEPVSLEPLAELLKSGQQPPPLSQLTGVAAGVQRLPAEPIDAESEALRMMEEESALVLLNHGGAGLLQIADESMVTETYRLATGKGLPSPALFALLGREGGQTSAQMIPGQIPINPALADLEVVDSGLLPESAIRAGNATLSVGESPGPGIGLSVPARVDSLSPTMTPAAPELSLSIHQKNWSQALGQQLVWMAQHHAQQAEIKVNPAHLGPIEVHLSLNQDQASVNFFAHEAAVRDVLENALPRLREMLSNQGLQLNQASVSDQSLAQQHQQSNGRSPPQREGWLEQGDAELDSEDKHWQPIEDQPGGVDHYI